MRPDIVLTHLPHHAHGSDVALTPPSVRAPCAQGSWPHRVSARWTACRCTGCTNGCSSRKGSSPIRRDLLNPGLVADVWIGISPVIGRKVQAMDQIVSQGYHGATARKIVEAREGRWGMLAGVSYAEPFIRGGRTYRALPMPEGWESRGFVPNDLPGDRVIAVEVPLAVPEDAFRLPE